MRGEQLPLSVALPDTPDFEGFHAGPNLAAVATVRALLDEGDTRSLLLHGPAGSGKTHLARALLREARSLGMSGLLLDANALSRLDRPAESTPLLCLDGLDHAPLDDAAALALIRLLDQRRRAALATLVTTRKPAAQLHLPRPDLVTRLSAFASFGLKPLGDDDRVELLRLRAHARGLHLNNEVAHYLLKHLARDIGSLLAAIDQLDRASLAAQRRLTIPFVQAALGLGG